MTTHELAGMLSHFRDAFGPNLKTDAAKAMTEAAEAFQSLLEKPLRDLVILGEPVHHGLERDDAGGGERPRLPHVAAHHAAVGAGALQFHWPPLQVSVP